MDKQLVNVVGVIFRKYGKKYYENAAITFKKNKV